MGVVEGVGSERGDLCGCLALSSYSPPCTLCNFRHAMGTLAHSFGVQNKANLPFTLIETHLTNIEV